jgi:hypothetical protein
MKRSGKVCKMNGMTNNDAHGKNLRILYYIRSALVSDMLRYIFERIKYQNL